MIRSFSLSLLIVLPVFVFATGTLQEVKNTKPKILLIVGSVRDGRNADMVLKAVQKIMDTNSTMEVEVVDLKTLKLPRMSFDTIPARKAVEDVPVQQWATLVDSAAGIIIVTPEYNAGYPGALKDALDIIYAPWNNKPVGLVSYAGGPEGGKNAANALHKVFETLQLKQVPTEVHIPFVWKAFDAEGNFADNHIEAEVHKLVEELAHAVRV